MSWRPLLDKYFDKDNVNTQHVLIDSLLNLIPLKGGDRRVRIFSAHNNWWATPEVSLPLPYQRSAKIFLIFFPTRSEDNVLL